MNDETYSDEAIKAAIQNSFGVKLDIAQVIARGIPTSHTTTASVFLTPKHQMYALIQGRANLTLGDIRTIIKRMGLSAEAYLPPAHQPDYFNDVALQKFRAVYPGRHDVSDADLRYYRLSSPYNPALIRVDTIVDGTIRQFDASDTTNWRIATKHQYKRIKTI